MGAQALLGPACVEQPVAQPVEAARQDQRIVEAHRQRVGTLKVQARRFIDLFVERMEQFALLYPKTSVNNLAS